MQHFLLYFLGEKVDFFRKKCGKKSTFSPKKYNKNVALNKTEKASVRFFIYMSSVRVQNFIRFDRAVFALESESESEVLYLVRGPGDPN